MNGSAGVDVSGSIPVVHLSGEIDVQSVDCFRHAILELEGHPSVIVDMAEVTFFDSTGFSVIAQEVRSGRTIAVRNPRDLVRRAFEIVGLDDLIEPAPPVASVVE